MSLNDYTEKKTPPMHLNTIKLVSCDAFGTLVTISRSPWVKVAIRNCGTAISSDQLDALRHDLMCCNRPSRETLEHHGVLLQNQADDIERMIQEQIKTTTLNSHAQEILVYLSKKYRVAITSNLPFDFGDPLLKLINHPFDYRVFSYEIGHAKPSGAIFKNLIEQSGLLPHEILHIGDSLDNDYHGALDAGMYAIHLGSSHHDSIQQIASLNELTHYL